MVIARSYGYHLFWNAVERSEIRVVSCATSYGELWVEDWVRCRPEATFKEGVICGVECLLRASIYRLCAVDWLHELICLQSVGWYVRPTLSPKLSVSVLSLRPQGSTLLHVLLYSNFVSLYIESVSQPQLSLYSVLSDKTSLLCNFQGLAKFCLRYWLLILISWHLWEGGHLRCLLPLRLRVL